MFYAFDFFGKKDLYPLKFLLNFYDFEKYNFLKDLQKMLEI